MGKCGTGLGRVTERKKVEVQREGTTICTAGTALRKIGSMVTCSLGIMNETKKDLIYHFCADSICFVIDLIIYGDGRIAIE